ncbi:hypothetical protein D3C80_1065900 [compost metagenome]
MFTIVTAGTFVAALAVVPEAAAAITPGTAQATPAVRLVTAAQVAPGALERAVRLHLVIATGIAAGALEAAAPIRLVATAKAHASANITTCRKHSSAQAEHDCAQQRLHDFLHGVFQILWNREVPTGGTL